MGELGFRQAMQFKWVALEKGEDGEQRVVCKVGLPVEDKVAALLRRVAGGEAGSDGEMKELGKRRMVSVQVSGEDDYIAAL